MQAGISLVVGITIGVIVLLLAGRGVSAADGRPQRPTALGWSALILGAVAAASTASMFTTMFEGLTPRISIAAAVAGAILAIGALVKRDRHWPTWVGLVASAVPALFWVAFAVGEVLFPH